MPVSNKPICSLASCGKGWRGSVNSLHPAPRGSSIPWLEMERRLLEMGFVEGVSIELLHEGPVKRDPMAVRIGDMTIALRRCDAEAVLVQAA